VSAAGGSPGMSLACLVVDANVVIKWHVTEVHTDAALRLLRDDAPAMHVPDLVFPEVGNILWKKVRRGDLTEEQARGIGRLVAVAPLEAHRSAPLLEAALDIAMLTGRTVYDSLYVALAVQMDCRLVTADEKLYNALKDGPLRPRMLWVEGDLGIAVIGEAEPTQREF
jgi:predicted nucleic acid-binding protein